MADTKVLVLVLGSAVGLSHCRPEQGTFDGAVSTKRQAVRCANGLTTEELVLNAIQTNRLALEELVHNPLRTETFANPFLELHYSLHHSRAQRYLVYLAQCALPREAPPIEYDDPFPPFAHSRYFGGLGLCPEWLDGPFPVSTDCQERVSGCLLARNNPAGKRVPFSARADYDPDIFALLGTIPTDPHQPLSHDPLDSYFPCPLPTTGADRSCGWDSASVGQCDPGTAVYVSAGAPRLDQCGDPNPQILGSNTGPAVLRACDGIFGCENADAQYLASADPSSCPMFSAPALAFTCPASGNFSIMRGPYTSGDSAVAMPASAGTAQEYPAPEEHVFRQVEGGFYGNLFPPDQVNPEVRNVRVDRISGNVMNENQTIPIEAGAMFLKMWACHARQWDSALAYLTHRFCAVPAIANCAATATGACFDPATTSQCFGEHGGMMDAFQPPCASPGEPSAWMWPFTTYLNRPCDMLADGDEAFCTVSDEPIRFQPSLFSHGVNSVKQGLTVEPEGGALSACDELF